MVVGLVLTSGFVVRAKASTEEEKDDNNFREDVIVCEEAVAHASACCGFEIQGDACRFYHYYFSDDCGCDSPGTDGSKREDTRPVISGKAARSVADMTCETMKKVDDAGDSECKRLYAKLQANNNQSSYVARNCR